MQSKQDLPEPFAEIPIDIGIDAVAPNEAVDNLRDSASFLVGDSFP